MAITRQEWLASRGTISKSVQNDGIHTAVQYDIPENFIYISHLDEDIQYWRIPTWPDTIEDSMQVNFQSTNALGRTAPVFTYSNSGPRTVQISLALHRDLMNDINGPLNNAVGAKPGEEQIDYFIRALQSIALPKYNVTNKMIEPPMVAVKFGADVFIKGIVTGAVGITYEKPIIKGDRYACVKISFTISEVDPYDATTVYTNGSFRGVVSTLRTGALEKLGIDLSKN